MKTGLVPADNRLEGMPDHSRGQPPTMRTTSRARELYKDALRLPWEEIERILAELAEREARQAPTERRSEPRHAYESNPAILLGRDDLRTLENALVGVAGMIVWCRHVEGRVHEVGLKFDSPLQLKDFILDADEVPADSADEPASAKADRKPPPEGQAGEPQ